MINGRRLTGKIFGRQSVFSAEVFFVKKVLIILFVVLLSVVSACMADEITEEAARQLARGFTG